MLMMAPAVTHSDLRRVPSDSSSSTEESGQTREDAPEQELLEPIAIVGFALKFPQDATTTEAFWQLLLEGRCATTDFPKDRMSIDAFHHPDPNRYDAVNAPAFIRAWPVRLTL